MPVIIINNILITDTPLSSAIAAFKGIDRPSNAIKVIKDAGGISVYAHPNLTDKNFFNDLIEMKEIGLDGIEVSSPRYGLSRQKELMEICNKLNLIKSGGSDFHGFHKGIDIEPKNGINEIEFKNLIRSIK